MRYIIIYPNEGCQIAAPSTIQEMYSRDPDALLVIESLKPGESKEISGVIIARPADDIVTEEAFNLLWAEALAEENRNLYLAQWSVARIVPGNDLKKIQAYLGKIWDVAHMSVKDICKAANMTQSALAQRFCIPKRTVEDWCRNARTCSDYIRLMMAECLGLIER